MEYLNSVSDKLTTIDEAQIEWIDIMKRPDLVSGTLGIAQHVVDFTKFSIDAKKEIEQFGEGAINEMNNLYKNTSGCRIMMKTESSKIIIKTHLKRKWSYRKMNLWNSSGFDIYRIVQGKYIHKTVVAPRDGKNIFAEQILMDKSPICIYLPLYNCIESLYIGIDKGTSLESYSNNEEKIPIIFYGHSVTQGAAASRSGNCFPNIIQRTMKREIINLSCSSCCRGLESMATEIGKMNCFGIVIDYTRNSNDVNAFQKSHARFYKQVRKYHPNKRIVLMTSCNFNNWAEYFLYDEIVKTTYRHALEKGENVRLLDVMGLFNEEEYSLIAVDGSHVNDIGMYRIAEALVALLI